MSAVAHIREYKTGRFYSDEFRGDRSWNGYEHNVLLRNEGTGADGGLRFVDVAMAQGADDIRDGRGLAIADFDNDGDLDMAINNNPGITGEPMGPQLLINEVGDARNWLAVQLRGTRDNRDAVGALVKVVSGAAQMSRHVIAGSSYASQHSGRLHFGLGDASRVESLTVHWPGGDVERFGAIAGRQLVRIVQGSGIAPVALPGTQTAMR